MDDTPKPRPNPRAETPGTDPSLHPARAPGRTLVEQLGPLVDELRQLNTDFGLRPYRVFSVVVRWSGGAVGKGNPTVITDKELLPTPNVPGLHTLEDRMTEGGRSERGSILMTEVSPRYTEDEVRSLFHVHPLLSGDDGFLELRIDGRDGETIRRRFACLVPGRRADKFDWAVRLRRQNQNEHRTTSTDKPLTPEQVDQHRREDKRSW